LQYIQSCGLYKEQALQAWAPGHIADPWLIAATAVNDYTIITAEVSSGGLSPKNPNRNAKIPDVAMDIVSCKGADLEMFEYVLDFSDNPKAIEVIGELIDKLTDIEVRGSLEKFQTAIEHKDKTIQKEQDRKTQREM